MKENPRLFEELMGWSGKYDVGGLIVKELDKTKKWNPAGWVVKRGGEVEVIIY